MGSTPRAHNLQIPLPTRSTEASAECFGRQVLTWVFEEERAEASFFILGDLLHRAIQYAITEDADLDYMATTWIDMEVEALQAAGVGHPESGRRRIESSQRGFASMFEDYQRMIRNWYTFAHPDSKKRHPIYDEYLWPPAVEVPFLRNAGTKYPVWGNVDAVYGAKVEEAVNYETGNGMLIVDWKSGTSRQKGFFQLNYYRFGLWYPEARAAYHNLDRVKKTSIIQEAPSYWGDRTVTHAVTITEQKKDRVLAGHMPEFVPDWYCNYCPVQHLCPADGDVRNRKDNLTRLEAVLQLVEPLESLS